MNCNMIGLVCEKLVCRQNELMKTKFLGFGIAGNFVFQS